MLLFGWWSLLDLYFLCMSLNKDIFRQRLLLSFCSWAFLQDLERSAFCQTQNLSYQHMFVFLLLSENGVGGLNFIGLAIVCLCDGNKFLMGTANISVQYLSLISLGLCFAVSLFKLCKWNWLVEYIVLLIRMLHLCFTFSQDLCRFSWLTFNNFRLSFALLFDLFDAFSKINLLSILWMCFLSLHLIIMMSSLYIQKSIIASKPSSFHTLKSYTLNAAKISMQWSLSPLLL